MARIRSILAGILLLAAASPAAAQYARVIDSDIDPAIFQIDEKDVLGVKVDGRTALIDEQGREFRLSEMLGMPLVLVLAYYTCDGSCSAVNANLRDLLDGLEGVAPGKDFRILTISFDQRDTLESTGAFRRHLELTKGLEGRWTFATFKDPAGIKTFTDTLGYKFFWSPRDRLFLHPGAFFFLTAEGRLARVLYALNTESQDVKLAVLDAKQGNFELRAKELINFAVSLCYSYNYKDGRYTYNIPLFVAAGSLTLGVAAFSVGALVFRARKSREVV